MVNLLIRAMARGVRAGALVAACAAIGASAAHAQSLGSQRVATSAATYLKIGVGARAMGMGGSFTAVSDDPSAILWNPAGLATLRRPVVNATAIRWPTDIDYDHVVGVHQLGNGVIAGQIGYLAADIKETTEYYPLGTGRTLTYSDWYAGVAYARAFTDRLNLGAGVRLLHEDLASSVGGPTATSVAFDVGSLYSVGYRKVRIGMSMTNFGPPLSPGGQFTSTNGVQVDYGHYSLPTQFKIGVADDLIDHSDLRLTGDFELTHPADGVESFRTGGELSIRNALALRAGYVFTSDIPGLSVGAGFRGSTGGVFTELDYAYRDAGDLGAIHVLSLGVHF